MKVRIGTLVIQWTSKTCIPKEFLTPSGSSAKALFTPVKIDDIDSALQGQLKLHVQHLNSKFAPVVFGEGEYHMVGTLTNSRVKTWLQTTTGKERNRHLPLTVGS